MYVNTVEKATDTGIAQHSELDQDAVKENQRVVLVGKADREQRMVIF
jgi:hypothetical protein